MFDKDIENALMNSAQKPYRENVDHVVEALKKLDIKQNTLIAKFYLKYQGPIEINEDEPEILEITERIRPNIIYMTEFFRREYDIPRNLVALTDDDSGKIWFYNIENCSVYEVQCEYINENYENKKPEWKDFKTFLKWYLRL